MEKINIVELLKDCPKGMELDCTIYSGVVTFEEIIDGQVYPIKIKIKCNDGYFEHILTKYGQNCKTPYNKCVIFPKGKTTWEGFQRPFKDGDIIYNRVQHKICICYLCGDEICINYCRYNERKNIVFEKLDAPIPIVIQDYRFATEEERQKLFQAIKDNGYKWNTETKILEKLVEPKFKVGDKIEKCGYRFTIAKVKDDYYLTKCGNKIPIDSQDDFSLVPNKFDITTLKPFDKVLVRDNDNQKWTIDYFSFVDKEQIYPFACVGHYVKQCIPYENNEHLLGKTNDCDEFYKTWK